MIHTDFDKPRDADLMLRALYELTLEACNGDKELMHKLAKEEKVPGIDKELLEKRFIELLIQRRLGN